MQFVHRRQTPVVLTAQTGGIDGAHEILRSTIGFTKTLAMDVFASIAAIGGRVRVVPKVKFEFIAQTAVIGFQLPHQSGHVVAGASPVLGVRALARIIGQFAAVVGDFAEIETGRTKTFFLQLAGARQRIATFASRIPSGPGEVPDRIFLCLGRGAPDPLRLGCPA